MTKIFVLFFTILSTFHLAALQHQAADQSPEKITVLVHGTTSWIGTKLLTLSDKYTFGAPGLHSIDQLKECSLVRKDCDLLCNLDPCRFGSKKDFYTFGWSGTLSFAERKKTGEKLYKELTALLQSYKKQYGKVPHVQLITFSHGGNVALEMVSHLPFFEDISVMLDLILVAMPVQHRTADYIASPHISKSYIISSKRDLLQVADIYLHGYLPTFPCRFFNSKPDNCVQLYVKINDCNLCHIEFLRSYYPHLPGALNFADACVKDQSLQLMPSVLEYNVSDSNFIFYNGLNLYSVIVGKRKTI